MSQFEWATACGKGSTPQYTVNLREFLEVILVGYDIQTVNDAGCGDLGWIATEDLGIRDYQGYDDLIRETAKQRARKGWSLEEADLLNFTPRECDLVICKDVFRHHDDKEIRKIISNVSRGAKYLLADYDTIHEMKGSHHKKLEDGEIYHCLGNKVDLRKYLGEPERSVHSGERQEKYYGLWKV